MIVTELCLLHIIRSDNGPCYSSKEFQQFLQCYNIDHKTNSPNHPRSNGFLIAWWVLPRSWWTRLEKKINLGFLAYLNSGSEPRQGSLHHHCNSWHSTSPGRHTSPTVQCTRSTRNAPGVPGANLEAHNKQERELLPGTLVWVYHRQNARWESATIVQEVDAPNSYWIMCTDGAGQPKVYGRTWTVLKIRSTPTDGESKTQIEEWRPERVNH